MSGHLNRVDPIDCACTDCITGWSHPFSRDGDELQFRVLMNEEVQDAAGDGRQCGWMDVAAE